MRMQTENSVVQVNMHEAKSQLSRLGRLAEAGTRVVIAKSGEPWLDLVPHQEVAQPRQPGGFEGKIWMAEDFDETPPDLIAAFEGDH